MFYRSGSNDIFFVPGDSTGMHSLKVGFLSADGTFERLRDRNRDFSLTISDNDKMKMLRFDANDLDGQTKQLVIKFAFGDYAPWKPK